jgi:replicative DNA helicase
MGKTALALNMFKNIFSQKKRALFYSLEMSKEELFRRLIAQEVEIDLNNKSEIDFSKIMVKTAFLNDDNFIIEDKVFDLNSILMNAKRHNLHEKIDFVVIDYLQIINNSKSNRNRESEVSEISRKLKLLAKELDCPVLCLSQLSRSVESRADKRPLLSDLRDSGAIEQDADVVMFVYRPSYYGFKEDADGNPIPEHLTIISIAKNRAGSLKDVKLSFIGKYTKFYNYDDFGGGFGSQPTPYQSNSSMQPNSSFLSNNETNETPNYDRQIESKRDDDDDVPF